MLLTNMGQGEVCIAFVIWRRKLSHYLPGRLLSSQDIAIGAVGLGFESQVGDIGRGVANDSPPLQHFVGAVLSRR